MKPPADHSYLLTGAAGFIGSHVGNRLKELGNSIYGFDNYLHAVGAPPKFFIERADVRDPEFVLARSKDRDAVIHLAAAINIDYGNDMPELAWDINVGGTWNILQVCRKRDIPLVFASSSEVYGTVQPGFDPDIDSHWAAKRVELSEDAERKWSEWRQRPWKINEWHPLWGQSPYSATKIAGEALCKAWRDTYGMRINVVRLFNTFGPYQGDDSYGGVIARFVKFATAGKPMPIYGDGLQRRDYLWIDDAVNAYIFALTNRFNGPMNFGTGTTVSIIDLARDIQRLVMGPNARALGGHPPWEHVEPRPGEVDTLRCDPSKAKAMGWTPTMSFHDGLRRYVEWAKT